MQGVQQNSLRCFSGALRAGTPQDSLKQCSVERSVFVQQRPESVPTAARIPLHSCTDLRALAARIAADRFPIRGLGHGAARSATGKVTPAAGGESKRIRTPALERSKSLAAKGCSETLRRWHRTVACRQRTAGEDRSNKALGQATAGACMWRSHRRRSVDDIKQLGWMRVRSEDCNLGLRRGSVSATRPVPKASRLPTTRRHSRHRTAPTGSPRTVSNRPRAVGDERA